MSDPDCTAVRWTLEQHACLHKKVLTGGPMRERWVWPTGHYERCVLIDGRWVYVASISRDACIGDGTHGGHNVKTNHRALDGSVWHDHCHGAVPHRDSPGTGEPTQGADIGVGTFLHHFEGAKRTTWIVTARWLNGVMVVQVRSRAPQGVFLHWADITPDADFGDQGSWCVAAEAPEKATPT